VLHVTLLAPTIFEVVLEFGQYVDPCMRATDGATTPPLASL